MSYTPLNAVLVKRCVMCALSTLNPKKTGFKP